MKFLNIMTVASISFAFNIMPYGAYVNYSNKALKDNAYVAGIYASFFKSPFKFEFDAEATKITYKDNTPEWNQQDLTAVVNYYKGYNFAYKIGIHNIFINQNGNKDDYDKVFFLGMLYYKYLKYNVGIDIFYSMYDGFNVTQLSPKIGFNFGNYYSPEGSFYFEARLNQIHISNSNQTPHQDYTNLDFKLQNFKGPWVTTLKGNFGRNAYKVDNGGFVVYNLGNEYKYSVGLKVNYSLNTYSSVGIGYSVSNYKLNIGGNAHSSTVVVEYSRAF